MPAEHFCSCWFLNGILFSSPWLMQRTAQCGRNLQSKMSITRMLSVSYPDRQIFLFNRMPCLHKSTVTISSIHHHLESLQFKGDFLTTMEASRKTMTRNIFGWSFDHDGNLIKTSTSLGWMCAVQERHTSTCTDGMVRLIFVWHNSSQHIFMNNGCSYQMWTSGFW